MDNNALFIIVACVITLGTLGVWRMIAVLNNPEKRKLADRLATEVSIDGQGKLPRSVLLQMEQKGLGAFLIQFSLFQWVFKLLVQAWPEMALTRFVSIVVGTSIGIGMLAFAISGQGAAALVAGAIGAYLPFMVLTSKRNKRQKLLATQLPEALDFLSRIMRAGHSLTTGLQMMGDELPKPLGTEFRKCYDQHSLGSSLEDCLKDMVSRVDSTDFAFFITAVLIQRQTGGDLSEVLTNISDMIRQRVRLQQHVKAKTAEGRFTGYILVAFPAVMFCLVSFANPDWSGKLIHESTGQKMLAIAFGLQMLGLYSIRKITTIKV